MSIVSTTTNPVRQQDQTHYLSRTDGARSVTSAAFGGVYLHQQLQTSVLLMDDKPGSVFLNQRTGAFSCFASLTPVEARLLADALNKAAAEATARTTQAAPVERRAA